MSFDKHTWPSFDAGPVIIVDKLSDTQHLPVWACSLPIIVQAKGSVCASVEYLGDPNTDLESIDRTRINVWLKRCRDSAPKDMHTSVARELVAGLLTKIQDDIEAVNAVPDESSLSRWY